ncbi:hypothetical protein BDV28DRAFT_160587 [Aspergillus coremiiformis]|uniref:Alpha/Beta hydrolase protein n=1 Tax=Aspergillus coremiiformis TaxID=138285 RepID=A0A5N6YY26_9EURO|nr:hypothetical protein BDV28DRAFT_160587 [Aspergillus coremiiformis]
MYVELSVAGIPICGYYKYSWAERLVAFEFTRCNRRKPHSLIFIGGLSDGLGTVEYMADLVVALQNSEWSMLLLVLSSSYNGWGVGRLGKDIDEIAQCVQYVVIIGHSTGSQDVMHCPNPRPRYPVLDTEFEPLTRSPVNGAIIQAPVSDRENSPETMRELYCQAVTDAKRNTYKDGDTIETILPLSMTARIGYPSATAVSSRRFLSLASPGSPHQPDEDDLFSSDLNRFVPPRVDKQLLLKRMIIPNASHAPSDWDQAEPRRILVERVTEYLDEVTKTGWRF